MLFEIDRQTRIPSPRTFADLQDWRRTVSRLGGRGVDDVEEGRGSEGQGAREASRGDPKESATENRPPMAGNGTGKGETVR